MGPGAGRGGRAWARATANSRYSVSGFHCAEPSACARVCAVARPSAIQLRNWSAVTGPYSRPSAPMILYISDCARGRRLEPLLPAIHVYPHELLVRFRQVDDPLDNADDVHGRNAQRGETTGDEAQYEGAQGHAQHDAARAAVTENEFVDTQPAKQHRSE